MIAAVVATSLALAAPCPHPPVATWTVPPAGCMRVAARSSGYLPRLSNRLDVWTASLSHRLRRHLRNSYSNGCRVYTFESRPLASLGGQPAYWATWTNCGRRVENVGSDSRKSIEVYWW
jgi:hypothetical protein